MEKFSFGAGLNAAKTFFNLTLENTTNGEINERILAEFFDELTSKNEILSKFVAAEKNLTSTIPDEEMRHQVVASTLKATGIIMDIKSLAIIPNENSAMNLLEKYLDKILSGVYSQTELITNKKKEKEDLQKQVDLLTQKIKDLENEGDRLNLELESIKTECAGKIKKIFASFNMAKKMVLSIVTFAKKENN